MKSTVAVYLLVMSILNPAGAGTLPTAHDLTQPEVYAHWIADRCIGELGCGRVLTDDALNGASAWPQFGNLPIEAYARSQRADRSPAEYIGGWTGGR